MKINKATTIICLLASVLTGALLFVSCIPAVTQSVISNIFTGFIVSVVISLIGYFHERNRIINQTENNLKSLYINMSVLKKITGDILNRIYGSSDLSKLQFKLIPSMAGLNIDFISSMDIGLYEPFSKGGSITNVYKRISYFQQKTFNVKNISSNLEASVLEYTNGCLSMKYNQMQGLPPTPNDLALLDSTKNIINIRTAKLHEYEASLVLEIDSIADSFYATTKRKESWQNTKQNLLLQIEDIVKSNQ